MKNLSQVKIWILKRADALFVSTNLVWVIVMIGILLRIFQYAANNSLGTDESRVALNIVNRSYSELLQPLEHKQLAPFGFLFTLKSFSKLFGNSDYVLRLFPLLCGLSSIFLFLKLAKLALKKEAILIATALFALSEYLIAYSAQAKQYSSDVTVTLILYLVATYLQKRKCDLIGMVLFTVVGAVAVWISHPSALVIAGICLSMALFNLSKREWRAVVKLSIVAFICLSSFILLYQLHQAGGEGKRIFNYMRGGFTLAYAPIPPKSFSDVMWFVTSFYRIPKHLLGFDMFGLFAFTFIVGFMQMFRRNVWWFLMLLSPLIVTLVVSGFHMYPFGGRVLLFATPCFLLIVAEGAACIRSKINNFSPAIGTIFMVFLLSQPTISAANKVIKAQPFSPQFTEDIKPVMRHLRKNKKNGDIIYLYYSSQFAFKFYAEQMGLNNERVIPGIWPGGGLKDYIADLNKIPKHERVWVVFSHVVRKRGVDEEKFFLYYLDTIGQRMDSFKAVGAAVYLYDLSDQAHQSASSPTNGTVGQTRDISSN